MTENPTGNSAEIQTRRLLVLAPALLLGLAVVAFFVVFERVDVESARSPSRMALLNPALALQRTLDRQGLPSQARFGLGSVPPSDRLVYLPEVSAERWDELRPRLAPWVEEGGRLVLGLSPEEEERLELYDWLGLAIQENPLQVEREPDEALELYAGGLPPRRVQLPGTDELWLSEDAPHAVRREWFDIAGRRRAITLEVGQGRVTVLLDASPLENAQIARQDHILWAADLFELVDPPAGVLVVLEGGVDRSLLSLAWAYLRPLLASLALLLALAIARANARLLPPRAAPAAVRRDLLEHMAAAGRFLWERGLLTDLLGPARRAVPGADALPLPSDERSLVATVRALQEQWRSR